MLSQIIDPVSGRKKKEYVSGGLYDADLLMTDPLEFARSS